MPVSVILSVQVLKQIMQRICLNILGSQLLMIVSREEITSLYLTTGSKRKINFDLCYSGKDYQLNMYIKIYIVLHNIAKGEGHCNSETSILYMVRLAQSFLEEYTLVNIFATFDTVTVRNISENFILVQKVRIASIKQTSLQQLIAIAIIFSNANRNYLVQALSIPIKHTYTMHDE